MEKLVEHFESNRSASITGSDAFIGSKLKQIAFVLVFKSKKTIGLICFSFGF
jgi:hypothetical protein